jgi:hypothetical protein
MKWSFLSFATVYDYKFFCCPFQWLNNIWKDKKKSFVKCHQPQILPDLSKSFRKLYRVQSNDILEGTMVWFYVFKQVISMSGMQFWMYDNPPPPPRGVSWEGHSWSRPWCVLTHFILQIYNSEAGPHLSWDLRMFRAGFTLSP